MAAPNIPEEQWAVVFEKTGGPLEYKKIPVPKPGPTEVLINIKYSGVCHTDLHAWKGDWPIPTKLPLVGGHEGAGIVVARGELVTDEDAKIGEAVGVKWLNDSCLSCTFCQQSDEPLCLQAKLSGYLVDGSFQQFAIASAKHVAHIPEGVPLDEISPILCAGITVYKGLKESGARPGQTVAIVGAGGGLGALAQQYAKAMGLQVIAIDTGEEKKKLSEDMGASAFIDFAKSSDIIKDVRAATKDGLGPHAVILVAVNEKPFQQAAEYVRPRGTVIVIGLPAGASIKAPVFESVLKMVRIQASYVGNRQDSEEAIDFFRRGLIKAPIKVVPLSDLPKVYELLEAGKVAGRYVLKHLAAVRKPSVAQGHAKRRSSIVPGLEHIELQAPGPDDFSTSVYGSRYAAEELPSHEMPEKEMPKDVAYRLIKDQLSLDGNPMLNLASFVTTYMEDEAEKLMAEAFSKNFIDYEEYPQTADIQNKCVNMIARLYHAPEHGEENAIGTSTIGSSEAIMLAVLAMKRRWVNKRKAEGKDYSRPNIVMNSAVQVCWEKAARYFDIEEKYVYCTDSRYVIDPEEAVSLVDENTIGICSILGLTYTGEYEDTKAINDLLVANKIDVPIHVDAASGGFVVPFVNPALLWDFRLEKVVSINVSGHKYGLVYPGVGWVVWRSAEYLPKELIFNINYLGADQASFTLNFSKGASHVIAQYYTMIRLGKRGYRSIMLNLTRTADYLAAQLKAMGMIIMSQGGGRGLPVVAFRIDPSHGHLYDEFAVAHQLRERGWVVPAYTMAPHSEKLKMMRVVVREDFSKSRCDMLVLDIKMALDTLGKLDAETLVSGEKSNFQFILRLLNTNVDGKQKIMYALTRIKGVGRRYSNLVCKKADVDLNKRAGEITTEELERIVTIIQNPTQYKIPGWFLNRQRDIVDGKDSQVLANNMESKLREDLERLKKIRAHRGLRHYWGLRVRGQHSKTTGRRGRTVGVSKKKG
ncbi:hypothetical protein DV735_g2742, partial [Chaetothyriales sp. CBS 134920]